MLLHDAVHAGQEREGVVPFRIGAPRQCQRVRVGVGHHDEAAEAELGQRRLAARLPPGRDIALGRELGVRRRIEADGVQAAAGRECTPYQIGGCGFCAGQISIGTLSKLKYLPAKLRLFSASP